MLSGSQRSAESDRERKVGKTVDKVRRMIYNFVVVWNMIEVDLANHPPKFADTADIYNISGCSAVGSAPALGA